MIGYRKDYETENKTKEVAFTAKMQGEQQQNANLKLQKVSLKLQVAKFQQT